MNHLRRDLSPLTSQAFELIESEAKQALATYLSARKHVAFDGPHGWEFSGVDVGRAREFALSSDAALSSRLRLVQPLVEVRAAFELPMREIEDIERGAPDPDLESVVDAARRLALAENHAIYYGASAAHIQGIVSSSTQNAIVLSNDFQSFPGYVSEAIEQLRNAGVSGPYAIALDADSYTALAKTTGAGGYPVLQHIRRFLDGPIVWAPALKGALVLSLRGGDFELVVGQDVSLGYLDHNRETISLYLEETFTFRLLGPEAAVPLLFSLDDKNR